MYPKIYLDYFRDFTRSARVFVAMPFAEDFRERWRRIFIPAAKRLGLRGLRVDQSKIGTSIHTDILEGIAHSRVILVDLSSDRRGRRNPNVIYELGLAHATRLPEEVIVVRSDRARLPFDFAQIRVHSFDALDPAQGRGQIERLLRTALDDINVARDRIIERTLHSLDAESRYVISLERKNKVFGPFSATSGRYGYLEWPELRMVMRQLIELQIVRVVATDGIPSRYAWTPLGIEVAKQISIPSS